MYLLIKEYDVIAEECSECSHAGKQMFTYNTFEEALQAWYKCKVNNDKFSIYKKIDFEVKEVDA